MDRRKTLVACVVLCALVVAVGCRPARAGRRCSTKDWGDDGTHVLQCRKGRWVRVMTRGQAITIVKAIADSRTTTTTTPPPAPPNTTTPPPTIPLLPAPLSSTQLFTGPGGAALDDDVFVDSVSRNGRYVAAESQATNFDPGDPDASWDVVLRDTVAGTSELISVDSSEVKGNGNSGAALVSDNGRYVVFVSVATNLDAGATDGGLHLYRRDRQAGTTTRIELADGTTEPSAPVIPLSISADGSKVAVVSGASNLVAGDVNGSDDYFVLDVASGAYVLASQSSAGVQADQLVASVEPRYEAELSADGTVLAFNSTASTLVGPGGDTNGVEDVFVRDIGAGTTSRVSVTDDGAQLTDSSLGLSMSDDGTRVSFTTFSINPTPTNGPYVGSYVRNRSNGHTVAASAQILSPNGQAFLIGTVAPTLTDDGTTVIGRGIWDPNTRVGDVRHVLAGAETRWINRIEPDCFGHRFVTAGATPNSVLTCTDGRRWTIP